MNRKIISLLLCSTLSVISLVKPTQAQKRSQRNIYSCIELNGKPTTVAYTRRGRIDLIAWQNDFFQGSGWDPKSRCNEVSKRFQQFSDAGELRYITTGKVNGYNVICLAHPRRPQKNVCKNNGLLITLEPKDNPEQVKNQLFDVAARISGGPITRGCPSNPNYYQGPILNLNKFLQCAPTVEASNDDKSLLPNVAETEPEVQELPKAAPDNNVETESDFTETNSFWWQ